MAIKTVAFGAELRTIGRTRLQSKSSIECMERLSYRAELLKALKRKRIIRKNLRNRIEDLYKLLLIMSLMAI
jgi:hypothetical protein